MIQTRVGRWAAWLPLATGLVLVVAILLHAGTPVAEIARYAAYAIGVIVPGTLVYRALRGRAHTLVEDIAMGAAVGLVLELAAWFVVSLLDIRPFAWLWPVAIVALFLLPPLRHNWVVRPAQRASLAWSWSLTAVVVGWTAYLAAVFLDRNPVLPTGEGTEQYLDLAYQLSLAGEARNHFPIQVPQAAGEPLYYHWFAYAHMAMANMVAGVDLAAVSLRFAVPALCALAIVLTAVIGWRVSGRPWAGIAAAALFFTIGELNFTDPVTMPFGTQATFVIWHGMSMTYSWVLLLALILAMERVLAVGTPGWWILTALLMFANSGAKATSLPVVVGALAFTAVVLLIFRRRTPWRVLGMLGLAGVALLFAVAVLYNFQTYRTGIGFFRSLTVFGADQSPWVFLMVFAAFLANMELRQAGIIPLLWYRLHPRHRAGRPAEYGAEALLVGGGLAGLAGYLCIEQALGGQQYFARSGFAFGVIASAWGYAEVVERAQLTRRGKVNLAVFAAVFAAATITVELLYAGRPQYSPDAFAPILPIVQWTLLLAIALVAGAVAWRLAGRRGAGGAVLLTAILVAGAPGLVMDAVKSVRVPNGGAYYNVGLPQSKVLAARFVRDHSDPDDVIATNMHCQPVTSFPRGVCDARVFTLSAYAERRVLIEGWLFAPRLAGEQVPFWDQALYGLNEAAIADPTPERLAELRDRHGVRWLVVQEGQPGQTEPSPRLAELAQLRYEDGSIRVYEIGPSTN